MTHDRHLGPGTGPPTELSDPAQTPVSVGAGHQTPGGAGSDGRQDLVPVSVPLPVVASDLAATLDGFEATRWWRVIAPDGSLWCESSDEDENRACMRPGDRLERMYDRHQYRWIVQT